MMGQKRLWFEKANTSWHPDPCLFHQWGKKNHWARGVVHKTFEPTSGSWRSAGVERINTPWPNHSWKYWKVILLRQRVKYAKEKFINGKPFLPDSILLSIFLAHCTKASSTFSPVSALVSKNISSKIDIKQNTKPCLEDNCNYSINNCLFNILLEWQAKCNLLLKTMYFCKYKINMCQDTFFKY